MKSTIRALAELVLQNIDALEADCSRRGVEAPSLRDPYKPGSEFSLNDIDVQKASTVIVAAAQQLINTVQPPQVNLVMTAYSVSFHFTFSLILLIYYLLPRRHLQARFALLLSSILQIFSAKLVHLFVLYSSDVYDFLTGMIRAFTSKRSARNAKQTP